MEQATYENSQVEDGIKNWLRLRKIGHFLSELSKDAHYPSESIARPAGGITLKAAGLESKIYSG